MRGGDTLSEIAQRLMGSARQWRRLYDLNRDVIPDPEEMPDRATRVFYHCFVISQQ